MNSQARSALAINPTYTMVLARAPTDRKWNALGVSRNDSFETTIRKILKRESWTRLNSTNPDRIREFAKLLGHPDRRLHELAYLEVGRAPYSLIKEVSPLISIETMRATLDNFQYAEWHSLAILILGQSDSEIDRGRVLSQLDMSHRHGFSRNLAAWASALIEMDGVNGLHRLQSLFIEDGKASEEQINQLILALSTHGNANADLRDPIADAYGRLIRSNPETAPRFVLDLIAWERWEFVDQYRKYKQGMDPDDPLGNYTINLYLSTASRMKFGAVN
jgi:hypothetical protein